MIASFTTPKGNTVNFTWLDGPTVEVSGPAEANYDILFANLDTGLVVYQTVIKTGHWASANPRYFVDWQILVHEDGGKVVSFRPAEHLEGQKVLVAYDSKSLGDTLAWFPALVEFGKVRKCEVHAATFWNHILHKEYPEVVFIDPEKVDLGPYFAAFKIGTYHSDYDRNKNNWRPIPLQQVSTDLLGLPFKEVRPKVTRSEEGRPIPERYVAISEFSTFQGKFWLYPNGWQIIIDYLHSIGFKVMCISREKTRLKHVIPMNGKTIEETIRNLQHAEFSMTVASGLAWLSWALDVPNLIISGFTDPISEFSEGYRVHNSNVCHGCYNDPNLFFDRANWLWCPRNKSFECTRSLTPEMVKEEIDRLLSEKGIEKGDPIPLEDYEIPEALSPPTQKEPEKVEEAPVTQIGENGKQSVLFLAPHCSTGGMPQYAYSCIKLLKEAGHRVGFVEWQNLSDEYNVQKKKIKEICDFYSMPEGESKKERLVSILEKFNPAVVHLQEVPEIWMSPPSAEAVYSGKRNYKIVETSHTVRFSAKDKKVIPDAFAAVCDYHMREYGADERIRNVVLVEYDPGNNTRPDMKDRRATLRGLNLDPDKKHILNVGLFAPWKNQGDAFEVARKLQQFQFHFVGNLAPNFEAYWKGIVENKPKNCTLWKERDDAEKFYFSMDALLFTSKEETNPIVVKEALSWGMPVFMRNLPVYCDAYNGNPLVTFIDDDLDYISDRLTKMFTPMYYQLRKAYE